MKKYWQLMKPGIVMGNLVSAIGGYFYASNTVLKVPTFIGMVLGVVGIVGGSCVLNNIIDRDIDAKMQRTKTRAMVINQIPIPVAFIFGMVLILGGLALMWILTNPIAVYLGIFGVFIYVCVYSLWTKRQSIYGTGVGSFAGSVPLAVGYVAVSGVIDIRTIFLFAIFAVWQMPHSYGIALFRLEDYKNAGINVLPVVKGIQATRISITLYTTLFLILIFAFFIVGFLHWIPSLICLILAARWLYTAVFKFDKLPLDKWGKQIFFQSIFISVAFSVSLGFNGMFHGF